MTIIGNNAHVANNNGHYVQPAPNPPVVPVGAHIHNPHAHNPHAQAIANAAVVHHPLPPAVHVPQPPAVLHMGHFRNLIVPAVGLAMIYPQAIIPAAAALSSVANRLPAAVVIQLRAPAAPAPIPQGGNGPVAAVRHTPALTQLRQWLSRYF